MTAAAKLEAREPSAKYLATMPPPLVQNFELVATAADGVARLRGLILTLAVQGKLVPQDPADEPASALLIRIAERSKLTGKAQPGMVEPLPSAPYSIPTGWRWVRLGQIVENMGSGWSPACDEGERSDPMRWGVLRTTAVQALEYRAREHKALPTKLMPRPELEVKEGDVLITRAGPLNRVGISCWVDSTPHRLMLSDKIVRFHPIGDDVAPAFVALTLNAGWSKSQLDAAKTGMAASQVNISQADLRQIWLPLCSSAEQSRILARVDELMKLCDALEAKGRLEAEHHSRLVSTLLGTLLDSATPEALAVNWQRVAGHFDLLMDRPEAVDELEKTILQLAVRGLLVPQDPSDQPAEVLLQYVRAEKGPVKLKGVAKQDISSNGGQPEEGESGIPAQWVKAPLGSIIELISGQHLGPTEYVDGPLAEVPYLTGPAEFGEISPHPTRSTNQRRAIAVRGDILITVKGSGVGRLNSVSHAELAISRQLMAIRPLTGSSEFLKLVLRANLSYFQGLSVGIAIPGISREDVLGLSIQLPPLAEQGRIVARFEVLHRYCIELRNLLTVGPHILAQYADALTVALHA